MLQKLTWILIAVATAQAGTITQTYNFNFGNAHNAATATSATPVSNSDVSVSMTNLFSMFNPALGSLQGVSFTISTGGTYLVGAAQDGGGTGSVTVNIVDGAGFNFGGTLVQTVQYIGVNQTFTTSQFGVGQYVGGSQNLNVRSDLNKTYALGSSQFSSVTGSGTVPFVIFANDVTESLSVTGAGLSANLISGSCNPNCGNFASAGPIAGTATLTYQFADAAPEPASMALLGTGCVAVALLLRRKTLAQRGVRAHQE